MTRIAHSSSSSQPNSRRPVWTCCAIPIPSPGGRQHGMRSRLLRKEQNTERCRSRQTIPTRVEQDGKELLANWCMAGGLSRQRCRGISRAKYFFSSLHRSPLGACVKDANSEPCGAKALSCPRSDLVLLFRPDLQTSLPV